MSLFSFKVLPATAEDAIDLATVVYYAHQGSQYAEVLHGMPPVPREQQENFYAESFRTAAEMVQTKRGKALGWKLIKAVMLDGDGREIVVGSASWLIPTSGEKVGEKEEEGQGEEKNEGGDDGLRNWPAGMNAVRLTRDSSLQVKPFKEKFVGTCGAEIKSLAVHPAYQRMGVGALLVDWGLAKADAAGIRTFVHSTNQGRGLYEKYGFIKVAKLALDLSNYGGEGEMETTCMLREVRGADIGALFS